MTFLGAVIVCVAIVYVSVRISMEREMRLSKKCLDQTFFLHRSTFCSGLHSSTIQSLDWNDSGKVIAALGITRRYVTCPLDGEDYIFRPVRSQGTNDIDLVWATCPIHGTRPGYH